MPPGSTSCCGTDPGRLPRPSPPSSAAATARWRDPARPPRPPTPASRCSPTGSRSTRSMADPTGWSRAPVPASSSSIAPPSRRRRSARMRAGVAAAGAGLLDAPVSGSVALATSGKLTLMVGGEAADVARARPVLDALGSTHLPPGRAGHRRGHEARGEHRHLRAEPGDRGGARARRGGRDRAGGRL